MQNRLEPSEKQVEVAELWKEKGGLLLRGDTGSGKTIAAVTGIDEIKPEVALIVGPLHTFSGWYRTVRDQIGRVLRFIDKTKEGKKADDDLRNGVPGMYFLGRERFRQYNFRRFPIDAVVIDECQGIQNRKSKSFSAAKSLKNVPYKLAMSATPAGNNFEGLWAVTKFVFPEETDDSFWRFVSEYAETEYSPFSYKKVVGEREPGAYVKSLPAYMYLETPYQEEPITKYIDVSLTPKQKKIYKELEETSILWLDENPTFVNLPAQLYMRLMQCTLAIPEITNWVDDEGVEHSTATFPENTRSTKLEVVMDLLKDIPEEEPIILYTHSKIFAELVNRRLQEKGYESRLFDSKHTQEYLDGLGSDYRILVTTIQRFSEGTDGAQYKCRYEIFFSLSDNGILNFQSFGRLARQGQTQQVYRYVIRALETVEVETQHPRLLTSQQRLEQSFDVEEGENENM